MRTAKVSEDALVSGRHALVLPVVVRSKPGRGLWAYSPRIYRHTNIEWGCRIALAGLTSMRSNKSTGTVSDSQQTALLILRLINGNNVVHERCNTSVREEKKGENILFEPVRRMSLCI